MVILWLIKKKFHASNQAIALNSIDTDKIVVSDKFKHSDNGSKYFIGYLDNGDIITPLCVVLPQISGYIKYFDDGGKNKYFKIEDDIVYLGYIETWNKIKKASNIRFHSQHVYDEKYINTKVKTFNIVINTVFSDNDIPKERNHYICIAAICIDSIVKTDKNNYRQVYLERCKYKI